MEERQYKDHYVPFAKVEPEDPIEEIQGFLAPASEFNKLKKTERGVLLILAKMLESAQVALGSFLSLPRNSGDALPLNWLAIVDHLKKKELIDKIYFEKSYFDTPRMIKAIILADSFFKKLPELTDGRQPGKGIFTHGVSVFDPGEAVARVVGEYLERIAFLIYRKKDFLRASPEKLKKQGKLFLALETLAGFSEEQKAASPGRQFNENSEFLWTETKSLFDGKTYLAPAQTIFWNYMCQHQDWSEPLLREQNTNAEAGHCSLERAILGAIYELVQRDGFLIYWLNEKGPPQIEIDKVDSEPLNFLLQECQRLELEAYFLNTTTDVDIPSCICVLVDKSGIGPAFAIGGGCGADWEEVLLRSLIEAVNGVQWSLTRKERGEERGKLPEKYQSLGDRRMGHLERLSFWGDKKRFKHFEFFLKGGKTALKKLKENQRLFNDPKEELDFVTDKFRALGAGYEIFYYQAHQDFLDELGYFAAKVVVPKMTPLYLRENNVPLAAPRLKETPRKLGFSPAKTWNKWPHPFP